MKTNATEMKPILFNTEMVRAISDGRKTVTRRLVKLKYSNTHLEMRQDKYGTRLTEIQNEEPGVTTVRNPDGTTTHRLLAYIDKIPPYKKGDILYVRETWQYAYDADGNDRMIEETGRYLYAADGPAPFNDWIMPDGTHRDTMPWRPSIHMPKEAARLFLRVVSVKAQRLREMVLADVLMEGITEGESYEDTWKRWHDVWDSTIKPADRDVYGWEANPWVWVIQFERCEKPLGQEVV